MSHADDPQIMMRLKRAAGHLDSVVGMVRDGRDCLAIVQQLQAVIRALEASKRELIHHHIDVHLADAVEPASAGALDLRGEIRTLAKYL